MSLEFTMPQVTSAAISVNPATINTQVKLSLTVIDKTVILTAEEIYAGEIYAGEGY